MNIDHLSTISLLCKIVCWIVIQSTHIANDIVSVWCVQMCMRVPRACVCVCAFLTCNIVPDENYKTTLSAFSMPTKYSYVLHAKFAIKLNPLPIRPVLSDSPPAELRGRGDREGIRHHADGILLGERQREE